MICEDFKQNFIRDMVKEHEPLVTQIAKMMVMNLPKCVSADDLVQIGMNGLIDALNKFDPNRRNKFKTYAEWRIKGAMLDWLRTQDILTRNQRDQLKLVARARREIEGEKVGRALPEEIALRLGISIEELGKIEKNEEVQDLHLSATELFSKADRKALLVSTQNHSSDIIGKLDARQKLERIIEHQEPVNRGCLILFYIWGFTQLEISEVFGVTESRISQRMKMIHSKVRGK